MYHFSNMSIIIYIWVWQKAVFHKPWSSSNLLSFKYTVYLNKCVPFPTNRSVFCVMSHVDFCFLSLLQQLLLINMCCSSAIFCRQNLDIYMQWHLSLSVKLPFTELVLCNWRPAILNTNVDIRHQEIHDQATSYKIPKWTRWGLRACLWHCRLRCDTNVS